MRVIIAKDGKNITYEQVVSIEEQGEDLLLLASGGDYVDICLNGWLVAKAACCRIEKRCLICVDEVFLDTKVEGL